MRLIGKPVIGNYRITAELGEGGMGAVYIAKHESMDEQLAVKVLLPQWSTNQQIVARFLAEARAASAIKHHHIIRMIDAGVLDTGEHFIAMEYLDGYPLDKVKFPVPIESALKILVQMCAGLEAAHARGIIHRDLKPANVFITPQPHNELFVKILDFGIAKLMDEHLAGGIKTLSHQAMGTPYYMSPEQARATRDVNHQTDVYALGAIAFELVTGERPYMPTSIGDLVLQQHSGPPPNPRTVRGDVPVEWANVIVSTLTADPALRPQGVRMFAEQLIAATSNGIALAKSVGYEARGLRARTETPALGLGPTLTADGGGAAPTPTTLSSGVGQAVARPVGTATRSSGSTKVIAAFAGAVVLAVAVFAGVTMMRGGSDDANEDPVTANSEEQPINAGAPKQPSGVITPPAPTADAAREIVTITVMSEPLGALLSIDGDKAAKSPRKVKRPKGATIEVTATRRGYEELSESLTVASADDPYVLTLERKSPGGSRKPKPPKDTGTKPVDTTTKPPKEDPEPFNPNDVGGD